MNGFFNSLPVFLIIEPIFESDSEGGFELRVFGTDFVFGFSVASLGVVTLADFETGSFLSLDSVGVTVPEGFFSEVETLVSEVAPTDGDGRVALPDAGV